MLRHAPLVSVFAAFLLAPACADQTTGQPAPWELGDDTGDTRPPPDTTIPDTTPPDTDDTGLDVPDPVDTGDVAPDTDPPCKGPKRWNVSYTEQASRAPGSPVVSGGKVFVRARADIQGTAFRAIEPVAGAPDRRITVPLEGARIAAADDGQLLLVAQDRGEGEPVDVAVAGLGSEVPDLLDFSEPAQRSYGILPGGTGNPLDDGRVAVVLENDPSQAPGWVGYHDRTSQTIHVEDWTQSPAALTDDGFAVLARTGPLSGGGNIEVKHWNADTSKLQRLTKTDADEHSLASDGRRLWWADSRGVVTWDVQTGRATRVHSGNCGDVHARDGRAVFVCQGDDGQTLTGPASMLGGEVWLWERGTLREVSVTGLAYHPRLGTHGLVWAEYKSAMQFGRGGDAGTLYWANRSTLDARRIAAIGSPCIYCNALFPDLNLSAERAVVAWNYARPPGEPSTGAVGTAGYAVGASSCIER